MRSKKTTAVRIGRLLMRKRLDLGISAYQVAKSTGLSTKQVLRYENAESFAIDFTLLIHLILFYHITMEELVSCLGEDGFSTKNSTSLLPLVLVCLEESSDEQRAYIKTFFIAMAKLIQVSVPPVE